MSQVCSQCNQEKLLTDFYFNKRSTSGRTYACKECICRHQRGLYTKEEISRKNRIKNLRKKYGLTVDQYNQMVVERNYRCDICKTEEPLVVDHCHKTNRIRGLLCRTCNAGLGMFKDSPLVLGAARTYLDE